MARLTDMSGRPFSGLVPHAVIGIVDDNVDPDEMGRIKVKFPMLHEEPLSYWLRVASPNAGKERGLYSLPEKEDEVLVLFLQGSQDMGVIIGQFWNGEEKPPTEAKDGMPGGSATDIGGSKSTEMPTDGSSSIDDNDRRLWRSRSGHLLVFDDTDGSETVQIWDKAHVLSLVFDTAKEAIFLSNTSGDMHIRTGNDLYLEAGNDIIYYAGNNIEGEASMEMSLTTGTDYKVDAGTNAEVKAGANMTLEATGNFDGKATGNMTLKGAMLEAKGDATAKIEGGAMCEVKGGVVMIN